MQRNESDCSSTFNAKFFEAHTNAHCKGKNCEAKLVMGGRKKEGVQENNPGRVLQIADRT